MIPTISLVDTGGDAHPHVLQCHLSVHRGNYFCSRAEWEAVQDRRRAPIVHGLLMGIADEAVRRQVAARCRPVIRNFNIQLPADLANADVARVPTPFPDCISTVFQHVWGPALLPVAEDGSRAVVADPRARQRALDQILLVLTDLVRHAPQRILLPIVTGTLASLLAASSA